VLVDGAALGRYVAPEGGQRLLQSGATVDNQEQWLARPRFPGRASLDRRERHAKPGWSRRPCFSRLPAPSGRPRARRARPGGRLTSPCRAGSAPRCHPGSSGQSVPRRASVHREPNSPLRADAYWSVYELTHRAPGSRRAAGSRSARTECPRICWHTIFICGKPQWYGKPLKQLGLLSRQAHIRRVTGRIAAIGVASRGNNPDQKSCWTFFVESYSRPSRTILSFIVNSYVG
jgi:hypothetical protein